MDFPFPIAEAKEGAARLLVPDVPRRKGPGTAGPWPFYNPTMAVSRDLSAMALAHWPHRLRSVVDGLAATGAWGIRIALESGLSNVAFNDRSLGAADVVRENLQRNGLVADVYSEDLIVHLEREVYDYVDIDPFGSPVPFLEAAFDAAAPPTGLGITATDTAVLGGTYPDACVRRYGARPLRCPQGPEIGLRILLGHCGHLAAERGRSLRPMVGFAAEHFLRILLTIDAGTRADRTGYAVRGADGAFRRASVSEPGAIGPMWLGPLMDPEILGHLAPSRWTSASAYRLLSFLPAEARLPPFFVTTDELAARHRGSPPSLAHFLEGLRSLGYAAARTHFHPRGVKTDAPYEDVVRVFRERMPSGPRDG